MCLAQVPTVRCAECTLPIHIVELIWGLRMSLECSSDSYTNHLKTKFYASLDHFKKKNGPFKNITNWPLKWLKYWLLKRSVIGWHCFEGFGFQAPSVTTLISAYQTCLVFRLVWYLLGEDQSGSWIFGFQMYI